MENNQISRGGTTSKAKKHKTHLVISLSLIGAALLVAIIIAVVAIVGQLGNRIDGKTPEQLYSGIYGTIVDTENYSVVINKSGRADCIISGTGGEPSISLDVKTIEENHVDGAAFYYRKVTDIKYKSNENADNRQDETSTILEVTIIDGVSYIRYVSGGVEKKTRSYVTSTDYKDGLDVIKSVLWDNDELFSGSEINEVDGGYSVSANLNDSKFDALLIADAKKIYNIAGNNGKFVFPFLTQDYINRNYSVVYDEGGQLKSAVYGYDITAGNFFAGNIAVSATVNYGVTEVTVPADVDSYEWTSEAN